jgi:hypothetical protein
MGAAEGWDRNRRPRLQTVNHSSLTLFIMAAEATHNMHADLARLDEEAWRARSALACEHQSADELHRDMIRRYFALHPRRRPLGLAIGAATLIAFLILI